MRKVFLAFLLVVALVAPGFAQNQQAPAAKIGVYEVQKGDTLWALSGQYLDDPLRWGELLGLNPYLKEPGRMYDRGDKGVVVIIRPGEQLIGLEQLGISAEPLPIEALRLPVRASAYYSPLWFWVLITLALAVAAYALYRASWRFRNPITSGRPIVEGGIPPESPRNVEERFQRIAERHHGEANPNANLSAERPVRVGEIESGFLSGDGVVQYRDRREPRRMRQEPAYRARFRFPNGQEEYLFFLQGCANDVTFSGARYQGFTWEASRTVVPAPQPDREAARGPVPLRAVSDDVHEGVMTRFIIRDIEILVPQGVAVSHEGGKTTLIVSRPCEIAMTRKAKKSKRAKAAKPAAPAALA